MNKKAKIVIKAVDGVRYPERIEAEGRTLSIAVKKIVKLLGCSWGIAQGVYSRTSRTDNTIVHGVISVMRHGGFFDKEIAREIVA